MQTSAAKVKPALNDLRTQVCEGPDGMCHHDRSIFLLLDIRWVFTA